MDREVIRMDIKTPTRGMRRLGEEQIAPVRSVRRESFDASNLKEVSAMAKKGKKGKKGC